MTILHIPLPLKDITIEGEIENPGKADLSELPLHSVIVKETLLDSAGMTSLQAHSGTTVIHCLIYLTKGS